jgi:hypothetical protein
LSYAVFQVSMLAPASFLAARLTTEISATKKQKQKAARRVRLFWLLFWRSKKVTSRRGAPFIGTRSAGAGTVQRVATIN